MVTEIVYCKHKHEKVNNMLFALYWAYCIMGKYWKCLQQCCMALNYSTLSRYDIVDSWLKGISHFLDPRILAIEGYF